MYCATICKEGGAKKKKNTTVSSYMHKIFLERVLWSASGDASHCSHQCSGTKIAPDWIQ